MEHQVTHSFFSKVRGVTFDDRQDTVSSLGEGESLALVREPENPHDPNAVAVFTEPGDPGTKARQVGFLAREIASRVGPFMDSGGKAEAVVTEVTGGRDGLFSGVNLRLSFAGSRDQIASLRERH